MALGASIYHIRASATAGNVNGGGFNRNNANMLADLTTDANTANTSAPVCSSASYNFVATDVGNWLYIKSGTNWIPGWYKIASVAANKATLSAAIGSSSVVQINTTTGEFGTNTIIGCATVGTPTLGVFTIDYSQSAACITSTSVSDYASVASSTTMTSATAAFTPVMVGNFFHLNNAGTGGFGVVGWYEIVSYTNVTTVVTDRTTNSGTAMVAGQGKVGGALSLGSSDDAFFEILFAGSTVFIEASTYTIGGAVSVNNDATSAASVEIIGYNTTRGDNPTGANRPTLAFGTTNSAVFAGNYYNFSNIITTVGGGAGLSVALGCEVRNCKSTNNSTTAGRAAFSLADSALIDSEGIAANGATLGTAVDVSAGSTARIEGNYLHDSGYAIDLTSADNCAIAFNIIDNCATGGITTSGGSVSHTILNNTIFGNATPAGVGIGLQTTDINWLVMNNIISGFTTGISAVSALTANIFRYNAFHNNTTDVINVTLDSSNLTALDPAFVDAPNGNFAVGANMKAVAFPGAFQTGLSTGYLDIGAVQRVEPSSSATIFVENPTTVISENININSY